MKIIIELASTIIQLAVLTLIPFLFFLFRKDKSVSFRKYLGLYSGTPISIRYAVATSLLFLIGLGMIIADEEIRQIVTTPPSVTGNLRTEGSPFVAFVLILIIALVKTSFAEELFFRGFLAKRLIYSLGFKTGNVIQAFIFGVVHLILFWALVHAGPFPLMFIFIFSGLAGWLIGNIQEKYANGSILPGWFAHGLGNLVSYCVVVYLL
jgi:membrane protease YdiL (CAAX protease family)